MGRGAGAGCTGRPLVADSGFARLGICFFNSVCVRTLGVVFLVLLLGLQEDAETRRRRPVVAAVDTPGHGNYCLVAVANADR
jgi:hypothetical protein